jgi:ABC-2 type transport system permease protein
MRAAWTIALKDLSLRMRDRSVFIIGLIAPLALAFIFNLIFGGSLNADGGQIATAFADVVETLEADGLLQVTTFDGRDAGRQAAEEGEVAAVWVLPEGLSAAILGGEDADIEVIGNVDAPNTVQIATAIAEQFSAGVRTANLAVVTAIGSGVAAPADAPALAAEAAGQASPVTVGPVEAAIRQLDAATYFVAGLSIFFLFFIAGMGVTSMLEERRDGTLGRLMIAPIARFAIVGGKSITSVIIGLVSMTVLVIASRFLMGARWGDPGGVALLVGAAVLAVVAIMTLVGSFAHTAEQAGNLQSIVAVTFGMLGGTFVQIPEGPGLLSRLRFVTPNAWFMRGLADLAGGGVAEALPAVGVLVGMAVVAGVAGLLLARKVVHA